MGMESKGKMVFRRVAVGICFRDKSSGKCGNVRNRDRSLASLVLRREESNPNLLVRKDVMQI
jgi:hypothetical protein